jgi:hypothetical protein
MLNPLSQRTITEAQPSPGSPNTHATAFSTSFSFYAKTSLAGYEIRDYHHSDLQISLPYLVYAGLSS